MADQAATTQYKVKVTCRHAFGMTPPEYGKSVFHLNDSTLLYIAGRHAITFNEETRETQMIPTSPNVEQISCTTLSPNKKYIAFAEIRTDKKALQISIVNIPAVKHVRTITIPEEESREIVSLSFSGDSRYLVSLTGEPDYRVHYWQWPQGRLLGHGQVGGAASLISFNPWDNPQLATTGPYTIKFWRLQDQLRSFNGVMKDLFEDRQAEEVAELGDSGTVNTLSLSRRRASTKPAGRTPSRHARVSASPPAQIAPTKWIFLSHVWAPGDKLVVGTDIGDILVFDQGELASRIGGSICESAPIRDLVSTSRGLVAAADGGQLLLFTRIETRSGNHAPSHSPDAHISDVPSPQAIQATLRNGEAPQRSVKMLRHTRTFVTSGRTNIAWLSLSPSEDDLVCALQSNDLAVFPLGQAPNLRPVQPGKENETNSHFSLLSRGFHTGPIRGVDAAAARPILITGGVDKTVRVWNYVQKTCELIATFKEEIFSVAIHPSGHLALVGFASRLRMFEILHDKLGVVRDYQIRACKEVRFSNGGGLFAAANQSVAVVYSIYKDEQRAVISSHQGVIRSLAFSPDDMKLLSAGVDGALYEWSFDRAQRVTEYVDRGLAHMHASYSTDGSAIFTCSADRTLREVSQGEVVRRHVQLAAPARVSTESRARGNPTHIVPVFDDRLLLQGASSGSLNALWREHMESLAAGKAPSGKKSLHDESTPTNTGGKSLPVSSGDGGDSGGGAEHARSPPSDATAAAAANSGAAQPDTSALENDAADEEDHPITALADFPLHVGQITGMRMLTAANIVATVGEDGILFVLDVGVTADGELVTAPSEEPDMLSNAVLMLQQDILASVDTIQELQARIKDERIQADYKLHLKDQENSERLRLLAEENDARENALREELDAVTRSKERSEREAKDAIQALESKHMHAAQELESLYTARLTEQQILIDKLEKQRDDAQCESDERLQSAREEQQRALARLARESVAKDKKHVDMIAALEKSHRLEIEVLQEELAQAEEEYESQISLLRERHDAHAETSNANTSKLKAKLEVQRQTFEGRLRDIDKTRREVTEREHQIESLRERIQYLEQANRMLHKDIQDRDDTLDKKEKRLDELKRRVRELEKIKFVLDYKYKEIKKDMEPKQEMVEKMEEQIRDMDSELERDLQTNVALGSALADKSSKIKNLQKALSSQQSIAAKYLHDLSTLRSEIDQIVHEMPPDDWQRALLHLHRTLIEKSSKPAATDRADVQEGEQERQRAHLERTLTKLQRVKNAGEHAATKVHSRQLQENALLVAELNDLRKEKRELAQRCSNLEQQLGMATSMTASRSTSAQSMTSSRASGRSLQRTYPSSSKKAGRTSASSFHRSGDARMKQVLQGLEEKSQRIDEQKSEVSRLRREMEMMLQRTPETNATSPHAFRAHPHISHSGRVQSEVRGTGDRLARPRFGEADARAAAPLRPPSVTVPSTRVSQRAGIPHVHHEDADEPPRSRSVASTRRPSPHVLPSPAQRPHSARASAGVGR